jgi:hypothetical protein
MLRRYSFSMPDAMAQVALKTLFDSLLTANRAEMVIQ